MQHGLSFPVLEFAATATLNYTAFHDHNRGPQTNHESCSVYVFLKPAVDSNIFFLACEEK